MIVPTYNERENVRPLLERIDSGLQEANQPYEVIIVDDDSPDETWRVAEECGADYPVSVVRRTEERGLATAVVAGFEAARGTLYCVMDADLQHPPEHIPALVAAIRSKPPCDIAIGSRMVDGGSFGQAGWRAKLRSHVATRLAWTLLPDTRKVADVQSGFFVIKHDVIEDVELAPIGYKILLEILVAGEYRNVREVGYQFQARQAEASNYALAIIIDYLLHVGGLWRRSKGGTRA